MIAGKQIEKSLCQGRVIYTDYQLGLSKLTDQYVSKIGFSDLDISCNLGIGIWDFSITSGKENRFSLTQLELTLTILSFSYHPS